MLIILVTFLFFWPLDAQGRRYFYIKRPLGEVTYSYEFLRDAYIRPHNITRDSTSIFGQKIHLVTEGWIYLPGLCSYNLEVEPEWERERNKTQTGRIKEYRRTLRSYDLRAVFLKDKPYTVGLYTSRSNQKLKTNFAPRNITESKSYGSYLRLRYRLLPLLFTYNHSKDTQEDEVYTREERDNYFLFLQHYQGPSTTSVEYEFEDRSREIGMISTTSKKNNLMLRNTYILRQERRVHLNSYIRYQYIVEEEGTNKQLTLTEDLYWTHRDNLRTNYEFNFERREELDHFMERKELQASLVHQLYENLITTVDLDGAFYNFTGGAENIYEANLDLDYTRRIPWGKINIQAGWGYKINDQDYDLQVLEIIDESHIIRDTSFTFLEKEEVVRGSVVVTDLNQRPYIEGLDYQLREVGRLTEIVRLPFGRIANGEEILVDYQALSTPPIKFSTFRQEYGLSLFLWRKWQLYYRYNRSKQNFLSGYDSGNLITDTTQTVGTVFRWKWSETKFELEDRDTTNIPTTHWYIEETLKLRPLDTMFLSLSAQYNELEMKDTGERDRERVFRAYIRWYLTSWALLEAEAVYLKAKGVHKSGEDKEITSTLVWTYGSWEGNIKFNFFRQRDDLINGLRKKTNVSFEIKRYF